MCIFDRAKTPGLGPALAADAPSPGVSPPGLIPQSFHITGECVTW